MFNLWAHSLISRQFAGAIMRCNCNRWLPQTLLLYQECVCHYKLTKKTKKEKKDRDKGGSGGHHITTGLMIQEIKDDNED